jgi:hypothetical protein
MQILEAQRVDKKQTLQDSKILEQQNRTEAMIIWNFGSSILPSGPLWRLRDAMARTGRSDRQKSEDGDSTAKLGHLDPVYRYSQGVHPTTERNMPMPNGRITEPGQKD